MKLTYEQIASVSQGVISVEQTEKGIQFHRFTEEQEKRYENSEFHPKQYATAGVRLHFKTDSNTMYMKVLTSAGSSRQFFSHDVFVDGKLIGTLKNGTEGAYGEFDAKFELGEGVKTVCIHFPWSVVSILQELCLDDGCFVEAVKKDKKAIFYGDSITQGFDAQNPSNRYAAKLADALAAEEYNKAVGGEVFCPWLVESREDIEPDYIFVAYGTNHWVSSSSEELRISCEQFFEQLVAHYPNATIFAITPIWRKDCTDIKKFESFEEIGEIIAGIVEKYGHVTCISGRNFVPEDEMMYADFYLHPNDAGFRYYSEAIIQSIKAGDY